MGADATFAELVLGIAALDGIDAPTERCLLGRGANEYHFAGEVAVAIRPVPEAPPDLDAALGAGGGTRVLTPYGSLGEGRLAVAALTSTPPTHDAVLVALTDQGVFARATSDPEVAVHGTRDDVLAAVAPRLAHSTLVVTAEAATPISEVYALLDSLRSSSAKVALGVALAPDVTLPAPRHVTAALHCADGLPEAQGVEGDLSREQLALGIAPLRERAPDCLARAEASGAAGGRVTLAFRIGSDGAVSEACVVDDEAEDPALETCLLELARSLQFEAPSPPGFVDAELPLVLRPNSPPAQAPICAQIP